MMRFIKKVFACKSNKKDDVIFSLYNNILN